MEKTNVLSCPVCQTEYTGLSIDRCSTCGWDLTSYPTLGQIRTIVLEKEQEKVLWARNAWLRLQEYETQLFQEKLDFQAQMSKILSRLKQLSPNQSNGAPTNTKGLDIQSQIAQILAQLEQLNQKQSSELGQFRVLQVLLEEQRWKDADRETTTLMLKLAKREEEGELDLESIQKFQCEDLRIIDTPWRQYSKGKFGFNVQNRIWKQVRGNTEADRRIYEVFARRVGWLGADGLWYGQNLKFNLNQAPEGHLPSGRSGDISIAKRVTGWFGGFGLQRICALEAKLDECRIVWLQQKEKFYERRKMQVCIDWALVC